MNVKEAVSLAKQHVLTLFAEEQIRNLGLEEVELDQETQVWTVTLGFSRPWDEPRNIIASMGMQGPPQRSFKVVRINDSSESVLSVKNREASP